MYIQLFLFTHICVYMFSIERRTKTIRLASAMRIDRIGCSCQARSASDGLPYVSLLGSVNILVQTDCSTNYPLVSDSYVCPGDIVGKNGEVLFSLQWEPLPIGSCGEVTCCVEVAETSFCIFALS